jgi:hypothetical protein
MTPAARIHPEGPHHAGLLVSATPAARAAFQ